MSRLHLVLLSTLVLLGACGAPPRVTFGDTWPARAGSYDEVRERWTRHDTSRDGPDLILDVRATLLVPEWRAAYAAAKARRAGLTAGGRAALLAAEREAAAGPLEVELLFSTRQYVWNDLTRGADSMWRIVLIDGEGREVTPLDVRRDTRPPAEIAEWFPGVTIFHRAYVVRFPRTFPDGTPVLRPGGSRLALRIGGTLGSVELVWASR